MSDDVTDEILRFCGDSEPFPSSDFVGLKDVDGFGQLPGAPGAAAQLAQDAPGFELGIGALAGSAEPGMTRLASFCEAGLSRSR